MQLYDRYHHVFEMRIAPWERETALVSHSRTPPMCIVQGSNTREGGRVADLAHGAAEASRHAAD